MLRTCLLFVSLLLAPGAGADEITIAAAADLNFAMKDVAARFERETGNTVKLSFGSSGSFYSQIQNGAPYDLFFSADLMYPQKLEASDLAEPGSLYSYAQGKLVLWVAEESKVDISHGLRTLMDPSVRRVAIANPAHAPYGRAAEAALKAAGEYEAIKSKLVFGENISQAAQFVESGNADEGFLALSLALAPPLKAKGRFYLLPQELYPTLRQACIILKSSQHKKTAWQFVQFMKRPQVAEILKQYGFEAP